MEEKEKDIVEPVVESTSEDNATPVVESTQEKDQDENETVDNNTETDPEPVTTDEPTPEPEPVAEPTESESGVEPVVEPVAEPVAEPVGTEPIVSEPVVTEPITTDPIITDPIVTDPVVTDVPVEDPTLATTDEVIPAPVDIPAEQTVTDDPATIIPAEPAPVDVPGETIGADAACADGSCSDCGSDACVCSPESPVTVAHLFGTLQECVTIIWRFHLKTRKHHVHVDLADFYESALDKIDNIIEQYQGICGIVEDPFVNCIVGDGKDEVSYLQELKAFVEKNKCIIGGSCEINSAIDDFLGLIDTTLYKLTSFTESAVKSFEEFIYEDYNEQSEEE